MKIEGRVKGTEKAVAQISKISSNVTDEMRLVVKEGMLLIHGTARKSIQEHQSRGNKYGEHYASRPGNPPNTDTGRLVGSIEFDYDQDTNSAQVGTNLDYGAWLEFGTSTIAARPWLKPAFDKHKKEILNSFKAALRKGTK